MNAPQMNAPRKILEHLLERRSLSEAQAASLLNALTAPDLAPAMAGALLVALRAKGITADEVRGFAGAMRALATLRAPVDGFFLDVTVNDPDPQTRVNRLRLLNELREAMHAVADFSKVSG